MKDINTYGDLREAVQLWLNRKDSITVNNIPMFINMAFKEFTRIVKLPYYETFITQEIGEGYNYAVIPQNFLSAKSISVNNIPYNRVDVETYLRIRNKNLVQEIGEPTDPALFISGATTETRFFFTRIGSELRFIPDLVPGDRVDMIYQRDVPEFSDENEESYPLLIASDVMLYLSLRHASIFLRDPEQEQYWAQKANDAAMSLMKQLDEAEWSGSSLVVTMFNK